MKIFPTPTPPWYSSGNEWYFEKKNQGEKAAYENFFVALMCYDVFFFFSYYEVYEEFGGGLYDTTTRAFFFFLSI